MKIGESVYFCIRIKTAKINVCPKISGLNLSYSYHSLFTKAHTPGVATRVNIVANFELDSNQKNKNLDSECINNSRYRYICR